MSEIREQGFERVSVLGGGLLGSSIAMAMKARGVQGEIWARSEKGAHYGNASWGDGKFGRAFG